MEKFNNCLLQKNKRIKLFIYPLFNNKLFEMTGIGFKLKIELGD